MSCCDDPTAHQPNATAASASAIKALTTSGVSVECPDPIVAAAMLEATQLTDREREIILGVLGRDELLRRDQQLRVLQLKAELQNLRRKGALKPTTNLDTTGPDQDPDRYCRRCRVELGRVINRGSYCRACRLKVCKACREYSLRTTDWVCTVCKKQMEIQAASGEWMNEFVKRPNKRRENRVCLPTADIIKRTIRRSWTISNPTPRWSAMRGSPELRPYNSLPRKQDINNYPSLVLYQANLKNQENSSQENPSPTYRRRSPRRTQSEDIYDDQGSSSQFRGTSPVTPEMERSSRMNPLIKLPDGKPDIERRRSPMRRSNEGSSEDGSSKEDGSPKSKGILTPETARKFDRSNMEKRVSFESHVPYARMSRPTPVLRTQSLIEGRVQNHLPSRYPAHHEDNSDNSEEAAHGDAHDSREENNPIELCEIEPFSGTVFRKMMVRRRRQNNARNISGSTSNCSTTAENGWRRGPDSDLWDILLPEGDDYKLVFMNSDGSSKEETSSREEDDNDSSSTASSFPIDECDWDYFEPGTRPAPVINWSSPFGSPRVYRRGVADSPIGSPLVYRRRMRESDTGTDEDNVRQDSGSPASSDSIFQPRIIPEDSPFYSTTQLRSEKMLEDTSALRCVHSEDVSTKPCCHACGAPTQFIPIPVPVPIPFPVPTLWPPHEPPLMVFGEQRFRVLPRNLWPYLSQTALIWPTLNANGGTTDTTMPATTDRDTSALETHKESDIVPPVVGAEEEITGYLECENRYVSSSDSSSDDSDNSGQRVRRMYNVSGTERHSDDALPSSNVSSDNDENDGRLSHSSVREDDMTSSGSDDTDSDDTGTVADQKSKRFSRIFVVNKNLSSSSNSCSSSSDTDTSDNDTDTELDCTVVLTNVKQLEEEKDDVCDSKSSDKDTKKSEIEYYFSSPGLSDVSAESVNSSDVDNNDLITKETNVNSTLSKANAEKNLYKIKLNDDTRKKKVCFDDADAVEKETFTDEVAVIKLNKRDIEAINRENDLPFGNEFKLSQAEHFKINKDEVDDAVNENEENSSCLVKSNLTKANKKSKKTAVTFSLFEGDNNKSEEDNKTPDNIEATSDKNDEEFIVSVISGEEKNSNESLTKEHLDVFAFSGTTEKAVNDDNKGKTNNYTKTVLSACSTIQANILFDEQHNENFNLNISSSLTDTFGNDDVNKQKQNSKDFITFSTSDNYEQIDKYTINDDDNYKTTFFSDSTTDNLTTTDDLIVKIVKNYKDFDTDNLDSITDEQLNDYFEKFSHSTNKTSNDNDVIDNKNDDETTISASHLTATRINDNEDIDTRNNDKFTESAGLKRNDHLAEDTGDNNKDNDVETKDLDYTIQNLTVESNKDVDTECFHKLNVFSGTTIDEGAVSDDMDTTDNEGNDFINAFEMTQVTITSPISNFDLNSTVNDEDVKDNIEGVVENISDDHFEESGKYGVVKDLFSDTLTTTPKLNKVLIQTCDENDKNQDEKEGEEALIDGTVTSIKLDDTDHAGLEKHDNVINLDNVLVSTSVEELRKDGDVERSEIYDENIVTTGLVLGTNGLNEETNKIISKSLENYEKLERNDGTVDLNLLDSSSKDATDEEVHKFEISSRKLTNDEKLDDGNEINGENDTLFDITYTIITDNEKIETIEEDKSSLTIGENKIETMELTNIDETIIEDIDKLDETIAACNLIDTVMNFDSEMNEYSNDIDLPTYDTISNAKTVEELPISQKSNAATLDILETAEILVETQENDNVDDYIVTEYDTFSLAGEIPQEISFTESAENINVTDNEYYIFSSPHGVSKATQQFNKLQEDGTDRFSTEAQKLDTDNDNTSKYETLSVGVTKATQRHTQEKNSIERADDSGAIEYGNDMLSSAYDATKNAEKIVKPEEKKSASNVDDDIVIHYEFEMLAHGTSKFARKFNKSVTKISTIEADDEIEILSHGIPGHAKKLTKPEEKIVTSKVDDGNVTDYQFLTLSSVNDAMKNAQKFTKPQEETSTDNAGKGIVTEHEFSIVSLGTPETTLETSEEITTIKSTDDNNIIEYALYSAHGTQKRNQSTENVDDETSTKYEFAKHSSSQDDLQTAPKLTKLQDVISTDDALSLGAPETTPRLSKSQEKIYIGSTDDNSASDYEYHASRASKESQALTEVPGETSTENTDDENVTKYKFAILSTAQDDLNNAQKFNNPQEDTSTDNAEKDIVIEHDFNIISLGTPETTLEKSEEETTIKSTDDNNVIEFALFSGHGTQKRNQSTENVDDENVTKYEFAKQSSGQDDLQTTPKLTKLQDVISTDDALVLGAPKTTPRSSKSQEKIYIGSTDPNSASEYEYHASRASKESQALTEVPGETSTENTDDENVTKYKFAILSTAQDDLNNAQKFNNPQEDTSTDNAEKDIVIEHDLNIISLGTPETTLEKSEEETTIKSTDDNNVIEFALFSGHGTQKRNQSTENVDDENVTKYEFAKQSSGQDDLLTAPNLAKLQDVISTDDALFLGAPKATPRLSKSHEKIYIGSTDHNSASEYEYHASSASKESQALTEAPGETSTENTDDENVTKYKFAILSSAQDELKNAQTFNNPQEETSTDNAGKDIVTEHEFNIVSLGTPKTTLEKSEEELTIKSTDDNNVIEYALFYGHGTQKRNQSTENVDDENVTEYEFAKHSSAQDGLQTASNLTKLQDVISTDDALSLGAPKTTPRLSKSQEKIYIGSSDDNSASEYEYHASSALKASQTSTEAPEEIGTENTGDENVTKYKFAILSSAQDDLKNAQKFYDPQEETSTDNAEKDIVTEHEFNIVSLGTPKTTLQKSIKSTDDNNVIEYALFSGHSTQKRNQRTENFDNENVTKYEFAKHSSAQDDLQKDPKLIKLQDVISTDDALSLGAPKTTPRLSASQEKTNIESTDDNIAIEYDASKNPQPLTKSLGKMCTENSDDENVTKYEFFTLSSAQDDLCNAQKWIKLQEVMGIDNDNVTEEEFNTLSLDTPKTTPRMNKSLEKTTIKSSDAIENEYDTLSSAYGILKIAQKLGSQEKINTDEAIEFVTLPLAESASKTAKILDKSQDKANTEIVDYVTDTCISKPAQVLGKLQEKISTEHTDDKNVIKSDNDKQKMIFEKSADDNVVKYEYTLGIPKFELKSFDTEEIDIFEENDKYRKTAADENILKFDYTLSSDMEIPEKTQGTPQDKISSERKICTFGESAEEINEEFTDDEKIKYVIHSAALDFQKHQGENINKESDKLNATPREFELYMPDEPRDSFEKFTRAPSPGVKFELKPFDTEEINIFEETDESKKTKNDKNDYALEYDYTFSSALGIPNKIQEQFSKRQETVSSGRKILTSGKADEEINKDFADDEKLTRAAFELYMLDEPRDSFEKFTLAPSPGVKYELKPFNTEEINIFEENDRSKKNKYAADNYAFEYDSTCSSTLGVTNKTLGKITKSQETISSADEINNEAADDEKIKYVIHSAVLDFQKHQGENIIKKSDKLNATPREFELYMLDEPRDSFEKFTRAPSLGVKYELKPFDTEEINIFEETDESEKTKNDADDYALEYDYTFSSALGIPKNTQKKITKSQTISSERKISTTGKSADEINNEVADDEKFTRVASSGIKFELKPFITEEINIFEENDKSGKTKNDADDYALENNYTFSSALGIPKKSQETISSGRKIFTKSCKSPDEEPSGVKFELKPFDIETISIFEETDKSGKTVALKDLDIVKNKQDLNYSEYSNRTVVYSSFDNNPLDISRRHEIIQSFDKTGRITDCTVDIKSDNDDDEDTFENTDKINLAQTFKFTLRSYGEEEKKIEDSKKMNVLEKIFKKKVKSEKDSPPKQQEIDRLINKMVEAISSEYPTDNDQLMDDVLGGETPVESAGADDQRALSEWNEIRSIDAVNVEGKSLHGRNDGVQPGAIVCGEVLSRHAARYTSLVMITQDPAPNYQQVSVVTSDTTTLVPGNDVVVRHTNWQEDDNKQLGKKRDNQNQERGSVTVITGGDTLSAFEEGLADDDSWVENLSHDEEDEDEFATNSGTEDSSSGEEVTLTCSAAIDQEEDLRGYHRAAIDFTLHTIVEESCEESEVEQNVPKKKERPASATDLEKYFFFGLGDGMGPSLQSNREDAFSETSSIYSEGMESLGSEEVQTSNDNSDPAELASSRLEKYFLSGFMGFTAERRDSDGSVGSDSEGRPSPEQRRKRLVRARGTGRSHSSSLDNLDNAISEQTIETQMSSEHSSSSDSENYDETNSFEKPDGQFDTVKRKKNKKHKNASSADESKNLETTQEMEEKCSDSDEDGNKTPQPEVQSTVSNLTTTKNQQSRDSGFVGSCDDLLREQRDNSTPDFTSVKNELIKTELEDITEEKKTEEKSISVSTPPATSLTRKDSFNNWSSDEETNLMMCKMRQFFKTMVANSQLSASSKPSTPNLSYTIKPLPSPRAKRCKPPQLVYFENELTRLMKTVPGIREDQVREIVEYLSSEDTWSDSYDSSDYTSSDLEITTSKTVLQQQISDSCKQIINKFDNGVDDEGDEGDGGIIDESHGLNKETAFVYQKLVASFEKMAAGENSDSNISKVAPHSSPPLIAKVMHHIGSRLVALMHEVSSGESHASNSPKTKHYHRRLQHKISSASSTTTEDDCPEGAGDILGYEDHVPYNLLPRSRSHDLLVGEARILHQSISGVSDITEEKEASDCERFSWRGSFESALLATDSRNRLSLLGGEASASASALAIAAKRRSAGDLLFSNKSLSREQLDRVRSCGSIGGANSEDKLWVASAIRPNRRRSSVPDATCGSGGSADGEDEDEDIESRSTLPRSLQGGTPTTNSLPRLPTTVSSSSIQKSQSHHVLSQNVKSARYRPPGFNRLTSMPKRAVSAPGLQPSHQRRGRRSQQNNVPNGEFCFIYEVVAKKIFKKQLTVFRPR